MNLQVRHIDITDLLVFAAQFPLRLQELGYIAYQVIDAQGRDVAQYVVPPLCEVPAGPFQMGSNKKQDSDADKDEFPQHWVTLDTYEIGQYSLTVAEYTRFLDASPQYEFPDNWKEQLIYPDHPVVSISWLNVCAYLEWLVSLTGEPWRMPTEAEWEKAARGTDARIYPWGDNWDQCRANTKEAGPGRATPVGSYIQRDDGSPYGCCDMAGNVWNWCSTIYEDYPYREDDGRELLGIALGRILRGGCWFYGHHLARASVRHGLNPNVQSRLIGARIARSG